MLECVRHSQHKRDVKLAFDLFGDWDYRFTLESQAATVFSAWEQQIGKFLHETTLDSPDVRASLGNHPSAQSAFYLQVKEWAIEKESHHKMCHVLELGRNTCQEFMAYTLEKAL